MSSQNHTLKTVAAALGRLAFAGMLALSTGPFLPPAQAELPHPSFVYFGEILNAYGRPLTQRDNARLFVRVGSRECGRTTVRENIGPAINFRVEIPLDDGRDNHYATNAARPGDRPVFVLLLANQEYSLLDLQAVPTIGAPGKMARLDLVQDNDADGDGLPDTWELLIMMAAPDRFTNLTQVRPEDDFDGDGVSNLQEFIAGTDPTWKLDFLGIEHWLFDPASSRLWLAFYSVPGKTYELQSAGHFGPMTVWRPVSFAPNSATALPADYLRGDGYLNWLGVPATTNVFTGFRLRVR